MSDFRLVLHRRSPEAPLRIELDELSQAIADVQSRDDFIRAEIWRNDKLLCRVNACPRTGKMLVANPEVETL